jgi:hypothetical protein
MDAPAARGALLQARSMDRAILQTKTRSWATHYPGRHAIDFEVTLRLTGSIQSSRKSCWYIGVLYSS